MKENTVLFTGIAIICLLGAGGGLYAMKKSDDYDKELKRKQKELSSLQSEISKVENKLTPIRENNEKEEKRRETEQFILNTSQVFIEDEKWGDVDRFGVQFTGTIINKSKYTIKSVYFKFELFDSRQRLINNGIFSTSIPIEPGSSKEMYHIYVGKIPNHVFKHAKFELFKVEIE